MWVQFHIEDADEDSRNYWRTSKASKGIDVGMMLQYWRGKKLLDLTDEKVTDFPIPGGKRCVHHQGVRYYLADDTKRKQNKIDDRVLMSPRNEGVRPSNGLKLRPMGSWRQGVFSHLLKWNNQSTGWFWIKKITFIGLYRFKPALVPYIKVLTFRSMLDELPLLGLLVKAFTTYISKTVSWLALSQVQLSAHMCIERMSCTSVKRIPKEWEAHVHCLIADWSGQGRNMQRCLARRA